MKKTQPAVRTSSKRAVQSANETIQSVLPFSRVVGQKRAKLALELAYIEPRLGGVLLSGQRGTAKSTVVRAFSILGWGRLPITLPINATEDRVVGGWKIEELLRGKDTWQPGILEQANGSILYIDEVNLLDDHIVNLILDVASTNILVVQREASRLPKEIHFTLVGTMNPEEGGLRPQLLDRFGLAVPVTSEGTTEERLDILRNRMQFENRDLQFMTNAHRDDISHKTKLEAAKKIAPELTVSSGTMKLCIELATQFGVEGHRAELTLALAARANAAWRSAKEVTRKDLVDVAALALVHRKKKDGSDTINWTDEDEQKVKAICT